MPFSSHESTMSVKTSTFESWKKTNKYLPTDCFNTILTCWDLQDVGSKITGNKCVHHYWFQNLKSSAVAEHVRSKLIHYWQPGKNSKSLTKKPRDSG